MLNGHAFHSFTKPDQRQGGVYLITQFIGLIKSDAASIFRDGHNEVFFARQDNCAARRVADRASLDRVLVA